MNALSKFLIKFGSAFVLMLTAVILVLYFKAGNSANYYSVFYYIGELMTLLKESLGAFFIMAFIIEYIDIARGKKIINSQNSDE